MTPDCDWSTTDGSHHPDCWHFRLIRHAVASINSYSGQSYWHLRYWTFGQVNVHQLVDLVIVIVGHSPPRPRRHRAAALVLISFHESENVFTTFIELLADTIAQNAYVRIACQRFTCSAELLFLAFSQMWWDLSLVHDDPPDCWLIIKRWEAFSVDFRCFFPLANGTWATPKKSKSPNELSPLMERYGDDVSRVGSKPKESPNSWGTNHHLPSLIWPSNARVQTFDTNIGYSSHSRCHNTPATHALQEESCSLSFFQSRR